jgi:glycosyltransferase involved in cell wall biosynthesis
MYPDDQMPSFGCFIKQLEIKLQTDFSVQYVHAVRRKSCEKKFSKMISYIRWAFCVFGIGLSRKYDIIHAHTAFPGGILAWIVSCLRNKRLLITVHGSDICFIHNRPSIIQCLTKQALGRADSIHAVSNYIRTRIAGFYPASSKKIFVQCMGVNLSVFKPSPKVLVKRSAFKIIFIGNLIEQKGWKQACRTTEELLFRGIECKLDIFGDGVDMPEVQKWVTNHRLKEKIIIHGVQPQGRIVLALQSTDLLLLPSMFNEGFSLVTAEALACGVDVVVSRRGALPELINGSQGSFVVENPQNIKELTDVCQASFDNMGKETGEPCLSQLNSQYSLSTSSYKIFHIYNELISM